jgi:NitT/TauT family transport system substrate-binding protein
MGAIICRTVALFALVFVATFSVPDSPSAAELKQLRFLPQWQPQAQFAGYYVAKDKGIYEKYGIDLIMLRGGPDYPPYQMLAEGKTDIATMFLSTAIQKRAKGIALVNIGQIVQRSGFILVARKSGGILAPGDLNGKKIGLWPDSRLQALAFLRKYNVQAIIVPQADTINLFLRGGVDAASAMWYNEYHTIINAGIDEGELTTFFSDKYGLNFPEDGIYALEKNVSKNRGLYCNFVKASLEGWRYAFAHPDEALDIVLKYMTIAKIPANTMHQKWMLEKMKYLIVPQDAGLPAGTLLQSDFLRVAEEMKENGFIKEIPEFESFCGKCFMHAEK